MSKKLRMVRVGSVMLATSIVALQQQFPDYYWSAIYRGGGGGRGCKFLNRLHGTERTSSWKDEVCGPGITQEQGLSVHFLVALLNNERIVKSETLLANLDKETETRADFSKRSNFFMQLEAVHEASLHMHEHGQKLIRTDLAPLKTTGSKLGHKRLGFFINRFSRAWEL